MIVNWFFWGNNGLFLACCSTYCKNALINCSCCHLLQQTHYRHLFMSQRKTFFLFFRFCAARLAKRNDMNLIPFELEANRLPLCPIHIKYSTTSAHMLNNFHWENYDSIDQLSISSLRMWLLPRKAYIRFHGTCVGNELRSECDNKTSQQWWCLWIKWFGRFNTFYLFQKATLASGTKSIGLESLNPYEQYYLSSIEYAKIICSIGGSLASICANFGKFWSF